MALQHNLQAANNTNTTADRKAVWEVSKNTEFNRADFHGFTIKPGFWYGQNLRGQYVATSGWIVAGNVYVYTLTEGGWKGEWYDTESPFFPSNFAEELSQNWENELLREQY